jgi:hypothetical protein
MKTFDPSGIDLRPIRERQITSYSGRKITPSFVDRYKYTRVREG